jgi:hypothetical protein
MRLEIIPLMDAHKTPRKNIDLDTAQGLSLAA